MEAIVTPSEIKSVLILVLAGINISVKFYWSTNSGVNISECFISGNMYIQK